MDIRQCHAFHARSAQTLNTVNYILFIDTRYSELHFLTPLRFSLSLHIHSNLFAYYMHLHTHQGPVPLASRVDGNGKNASRFPTYILRSSSSGGGINKNKFNSKNILIFSLVTSLRMAELQRQVRPGTKWNTKRYPSKAANAINTNCFKNKILNIKMLLYNTNVAI